MKRRNLQSFPADLGRRPSFDQDEQDDSWSYNSQWSLPRGAIQRRPAPIQKMADFIRVNRAQPPNVSRSSSWSSPFLPWWVSIPIGFALAIPLILFVLSPLLRIIMPHFSHFR
jgi:hypothetical protein